ncbi:ExbD/TolR family protein [Lysobacter humi (ex Lee et al. 2017)]
MAAYADAPRNDAIAQINITPLVDVMLVLLVIFMIAAPAVTQTLATRLPADTRIETKPSMPLQLEVTALGEFTLDGRALAEPALRAALAEVARRAPDTVLRIRASDAADYQAFATALAAAQGSGLVNLSVQ